MGESEEKKIERKEHGPILLIEISLTSIGATACISNYIPANSGVLLLIHALTSTAVQLNRRWS